MGSNCVAKGGFKRYSDQITKDICGAKDEVLNTLLPMLAKELERSKTGADRIVALAALGSLGTEEIIPMLQPYISGKEESPAERLRALISLVRVADIAPQKVIWITFTFFFLKSNCNDRSKKSLPHLSEMSMNARKFE